jgi:mRNA interferase MazF
MPEFQPGDLVLIPFPYTDLSASKQRPAVVLSSLTFNATERDIIVCGVTSNLANSANSVLIGSQDMESGTLPVPSRVKPGKVATLQKSIVRKRVGRLHAATMAQVMREFDALFK